MAININDAELLSVQTMTKIANRIKNKARAIARLKNAGTVGKKTGSIKLGIPRTTRYSVIIELILDTKVSPDAPAYEWGSGTHDPDNPHYIAIRARRKKYLKFEGTNEWKGQTIIVKAVQHPGVAARPFLKPAIEETRKQNKEEIKQEVGKNMRLLIRGMARKV